MENLYVYADFDWLDGPELVGTLGHEQLRGSASFSFVFDKEWLSRHGNISLCADLHNYAGRQYTLPGQDIFGCFGDALPDRWGRTLLNRREQIAAEEEKRPARRLGAYDYLTGIDDFSRMGGLRFKRPPEGEYINSDARQLRIPPIADLRSLTTASMEIERNEESSLLPEKKWIEQLVRPGSSLGGARPKASVVDEKGRLCMAKFPSRSDDYDVALWEHHSHLLAKEAGIEAAETRVVNAGDNRHALLSLRFDRTPTGRRRHFASAMSLIGLSDGCNADTGNGYLDIVDFILQGCSCVKENLRQLYRRVAFNIAIGNSDDHFRNHGFILATPQGWTLAPAYDLNPTLAPRQSLLINASSNAASLALLLESCEEYMLTAPEARAIVAEVKQGVARWRELAARLGIAKREIEMFEPTYRRADDIHI